MSDGEPEVDGAAWDEAASESFLELGEIAVPERRLQIRILLEVLDDLEALRDRPAPSPEARAGGDRRPRILEICPGGGDLAAALLRRFPSVRLHAVDGSAVMLRALETRVEAHAERLTTVQARLEEPSWRTPDEPFVAVVSSLAIHHLVDDDKRKLFRDLYRALEDGGLFLWADLVQPSDALALRHAARRWDELARTRAEAMGRPELFREFAEEGWNHFRTPDEGDRPATVARSLELLSDGGFVSADVLWLDAGHAIFCASR